MKDLLDIRKDIDKIDEQIVKLYEERMKLTSDVAEYKINTGKQVFDKEREESKLATLQKKAESDFTRHGIRELFEQIMAMSRKKQYKLLTEHGIMPPQEFEPIHTLDYSNARIVFQGLEGAYSQLAMEQFFGENCNNFHVESWKDAMEAIKNGEADYAVLPIENSSAGIVSENYDLLVEYDNYIVGEQIIRIDHALLGLEDADERDIRTVYSHKQSLMQCSEFLDSHADWEKFSVSNNAVAAKKVKEDGEISQAAIASAKNAQIYHRRQGPERELHPPRSAALHAHRRDDARGPAVRAAARPLRRHAAPGALHAAGAFENRHALGEHPECRHRPDGRARDRAPLARHATYREPHAAPRARLCGCAGRRRHHEEGRGRSAPRARDRRPRIRPH